MTAFTTFYLSRVIGKKVFHTNGQFVGVVKDLLIDPDYMNHPLERPVVYGIKIKKKGLLSCYSFDSFEVEKINGKISVSVSLLQLLPEEKINSGIFLADIILDKQIVDLNGRKVVRVNDIRLVSIAVGTFAVAVDIGVEGLLRRIGIAKPLKSFFSLFGVDIPAKFILWENVEAVDFSNFNIKLSKSVSKLHTLHPSDLADIIEELGKKTITDVFSSLDEEKAADVLEELETETQIHIIENLPVEKVADVLEKMPADEVADILDNIENERAELLLNEMEKDSSQEVRELLEYPDNTVGRIMSTETLSFTQNNSIADVLQELRVRKPEAETLYNLFVVNDEEELVATLSLRDVVISDPLTPIVEVMKPTPVYLYDNQRIDDIAEIISKYNLLAIPVVDTQNRLQGMVVIDDVVEDLINKRRTNK
jgi:CBS domain-containing protein